MWTRSWGQNGRAVLLFASMGAAACASDHHVSEWGELGHPNLLFYAEQPDISAHLSEIDADADLRDLKLDHELVAETPDTRYVARSYVGPGLLGREVHALRVATPNGVVLALGPVAASDTLRHEPTELVVSASAGDGSAGEFRSMTDLTGAGAPDVILRGEDGRFTIFALHPRASVRIEASLEVPATEIADVDGDGRLDLRGRVLVDQRDPVHPDLVDVATFDGTRFTDHTPAAKAFHARLRDERASAPETADPAARLNGALELAWHAILAGDDPKKALEQLGGVKPPADLAGSFEAYRVRIGKITR